MEIREYFEVYKKVKRQKENPIKSFTFLDSKVNICRYLKECKDKIIASINYAFFDSREKWLMVAYSEDSCHYIYLNTRLLTDYPKIFENQVEYENYLTIYGTFAVLLKENIKIEAIDDSRVLYEMRLILKDLTNQIFFDDKFRLNLSRFANNDKPIELVYKYGYDFFYHLFLSFLKGYITQEVIIKILKQEQLEQNTIKELFHLYYQKFKIEGILDSAIQKEFK